jgi:hypothetical protein
VPRTKQHRLVEDRLSKMLRTRQHPVDAADVADLAGMPP